MSCYQPVTMDAFMASREGATMVLLEDRQGDEKISTMQTGLGGKPSKMEPSAPHAAQRGQMETFQPHPGMATFLHMPPASRQAHSRHDSLTVWNAACKMSWNHILRQV